MDFNCLGFAALNVPMEEGIVMMEAVANLLAAILFFMTSGCKSRIPSDHLKSEGPTTLYLMIPLLILAFLFAGISIPVKIIIAFGVCTWMLLEKYWKRAKMEHNLVLCSGVRFGIGYLCAMVFLIYKFRRRHLSMYSVIEDFLESDNKLAPIRYSYSDLKKMTRGFREKLGEGGFGSVYKGAVVVISRSCIST